MRRSLSIIEGVSDGSGGEYNQEIGFIVVSMKDLRDDPPRKATVVELQSPGPPLPRLMATMVQLNCWLPYAKMVNSLGFAWSHITKRQVWVMQ